ncbi:MAG: von Willebrand factor type A domain-containing protein [Verrucomicrobiae bacterium]|nr:von Willebrand factor type A domain-containing protein [Verrucomicrobiae bacterium]
MKTEIITPDDPRLTAYAAGELSPEESAAFERQLEESPGARAELESIRETMALLRGEFARELDEVFSAASRHGLPRVLEMPAGLSDPDVARIARWLPTPRTAILGLAAVLVAMAVVAPVVFRRPETVERLVAQAPASNRSGASVLGTKGMKMETVAFADGSGTAIDLNSVPRPVSADSGLVTAVSGRMLVSDGNGSLPANLDAKPLADDLIVAEARRLADDPIRVQNQAVPVAGSADKPVTVSTGGADGFTGGRGNVSVMAGGEILLTPVGTPPSMVSAPAPRTHGGSIEIAGGTKAEDGQKTRSLFASHTRTDSDGQKAVRVKGRVSVAAAPAPMPDAGAMSFTHSGTAEPWSATEGRPEALSRLSADDAMARLPIAGGVANDYGVPVTATPVEGSDATGFRFTLEDSPGGKPGGNGTNGKFLRQFLSGPDPGTMRGFDYRDVGPKDEVMRESKIQWDNLTASVGGGGSIDMGSIYMGTIELSAGALPADVNKTLTDLVTQTAAPGVDSYGREVAREGASVAVSGMDLNWLNPNPYRKVDVLSSDPARGAMDFDAGLALSESEVLGAGLFGAGGAIPVTGLAETSLYTLPPVAPADPVAAPSHPVPGAGKFARTWDNPFKDPMHEELSTFSVDVDTASYTQVRRLILKENRLPHRDQVRIEEMINYFDYPEYETPKLDPKTPGEGGAPFSITLGCASAPWDTARRVVRIGLKGADLSVDERHAANLVFLLDVSGSMKPEDKLPLLQKTLREFVGQLRDDDRVTMVAYASKTGEVLEPTPGSEKKKILAAIDALSAGGSTNGEGGIRLAYRRARENFVEGGVNRILLATDGDFNVGQDSDADLVRLVEHEAKSGVYLTVLGFGTGNFNDSMLEKITNKGNGQFHYIDRLEEGRRVLVEQASGSLVTIAKDVKIQVDFNPARVGAYRLLGYSNRVMPREHFADDTKDAGEIGAGHSVTALYEVIPVESLLQMTRAEPLEELRYKQSAGPENSPLALRERALKARGVSLVDSPELLTVRLRYKRPDADRSELVEVPLNDEKTPFAQTDADFRFATAVGMTGLFLRDDPGLGDWLAGDSVARLREIGRVARAAIGDGDEYGRRAEFVEMVGAIAKLGGASTEADDEPVPESGDVGRSVRKKLDQLR